MLAVSYFALMQCLPWWHRPFLSGPCSPSSTVFNVCVIRNLGRMKDKPPTTEALVCTMVAQLSLEEPLRAARFESPYLEI